MEVYTTVQKSEVSRSEENSDSKDIYNVSEDFCFKSMLTILKQMYHRFHKNINCFQNW